MSALIEQAFANKVMDAEVHHRFVLDIERYAQEANIPVHMICTRLATYCSPQEVNYVRRLRFHAAEGKYGMAFVGVTNLEQRKPVAERMMAIAGACLRNFTSARIMTIGEVLELKDDVGPTVVLIPNFYVEKSGLKRWHTTPILDFLYKRMANSLQTFVYVQSLESVGVEMGPTIEQHLRTYFEIVSA